MFDQQQVTNGTLWEALEVVPDTDYCWGIGGQMLWARKSEDEWLLASEPEAEVEPETQRTEARLRGKPEDLPWVRYIPSRETRRFRLLPCTPDRAVVVSSDTAVNILPQVSSLFYVDVPVWVRVVIGKKDEMMLGEFPSTVLSNTWFGDPMGGELCYTLRSMARRVLQELELSPDKAICPVLISNRSPAQVDFRKMCVHVERLRVYRCGDRLWTNQVHIEVVGEDQDNHVSFSRKTPNAGQKCELLTKERVPAERSMLHKGVSILKSFTSM